MSSFWRASVNVPRRIGGLRAAALEPRQLGDALRALRDRRTIVRLIFVVYWLLIFEGALRKWVFPQYNKIIFFDRDPVVLAIYYLAARSRIVSRSAWLTLGMALSVLILPAMLVQLATSGIGVTVLAYGWRNYFFYLPLAFVMAAALEADDLRRFVRQNCLVAIPMALLVYVQYLSPPTAFVNRGIDVHAFVFQVVTGVVRTTATFTFTAGYALYAASVFAIVLSTWMRPDLGRLLGRKVQLAASFAAISMVALSGSRTVFALVLIIVLAGLGGPLFLRGGSARLRAMAVPLGAVLLGGLVFLTVFHGAFHDLSMRERSAVAQEGSTTTRALSMFTSVANVFGKAPLLGYGIGYGTNGGMAASDFDTTNFRLAEDEWPRTYLELGPLYAVGYFTLRIGLVVSMFLAALRAAKASTDPLPLLLAGFIGITVLNGEMTMQGTINGYAWLFVGFTLAAARVGSLARR